MSSQPNQNFFERLLAPLCDYCKQRWPSAYDHCKKKWVSCQDTRAAFRVFFSGIWKFFWHDFVKELWMIWIPTLIVLSIVTFVSNEKFSESINGLAEWITTNQTLVKAIVGMVLIIILAPFKFFPKLIVLIKESRLSRNVGLYYYSPNNETEIAEQNNDVMKQKGNISDKLFIHCATGWETFAAQNSPLHEAITQHVTHIKIIMAHPYSEKVMRRADSLPKITREGYRDEIIKTLKSLCDIKQSRHSSILFDVKLYDETPCWKDIIVDDFAWMYHYVEMVHVNNTPCYGYRAIKPRKNGINCMYDHLHDGFLKDWDDPRLIDFKWNVETLTFLESRSSTPATSPTAEPELRPA